jgi:hypothetical protein
VHLIAPALDLAKASQGKRRKRTERRKQKNDAQETARRLPVPSVTRRSEEDLEEHAGCDAIDTDVTKELVCPVCPKLV